MFKTLMAAAGALCLASTAGAAAIATSDMGWVSGTFDNFVGNRNIYAGRVGADRLNDFFVFDLTGATKVTSLAINFASYGKYNSTDASETYNLYDYTGPLSTLTSRATSATAFNDLGSGRLYGSTVLSSPGLNAAMPTFSVTLSNLAVSDFNAAIDAGSSYFVIGGTLSTLRTGSDSEAIFSDSNDNRLDVVTLNTIPAPVPEPATWAMFIGGFGLIGGAMRRRQRSGVLATAR